MKTLRIAQAALATILATGISSNTFAFMAVPVDQPAEVQTSLSEMVDSLRNEIALGETSCEDMLAKLDGVLEDIDAKLDQGVPNESEYLEARDQVTQMRYDLECIGTNLTQQFGGPDGMPIAGEGGFPAGGSTPNTPNGSRTSGGGGSSGGGGFSGAGGGLATLGTIGGVLGAMANDDNNPGFVASQSFAN